MRPVLTLLIAAMLSNPAFSSTSVSGSYASGNWTLSGSPYLINAAITVPAGQTLHIDPGVQVIFTGYYNITVDGILNATGTATDPITFKIQDTTGWYDNTTVSGGWAGVTINTYNVVGIADTSILQYCNISDMKMGLPGHTLFAVWRNLKMSHCNFYHNQSFASVASGEIIELDAAAEMAYCNVHDNFATYAIIRIGNSSGICHIHDSKLYNNGGNAATIWGVFCNTLIDNNEIYNNTSSTGACAVYFYGGSHATVRHNKIHDNTSDANGAITAISGTIDIDGNLLCNNVVTAAWCGATDGGGGLHVSFNDNAIYKDSTFYIVRNNIIANNQTNFYGAGIFINSCNTEVMNNTVVNNQADLDGSGMYIESTGGITVHCKNNIFYGNERTGISDEGSIVCMGPISMSYDYNWLRHSYSADVVGGLTLIGDTVHNIMSASPAFVAPTTSYGSSASALTANFSLLSSSGCINKGDTAAAYATAVDFANNTRINGGKIDMGAIEYTGNTKVSNVAANAGNTLQLYPNPAGREVFAILPEAAGTIELYDVTGKIVVSQNVNSLTTYINLRSLSPGIFVVTWTHGNETTVSRLSVQ